ncbi:MAG: acyltransferase [Gemmataceae bacterium]
MAPLATTQQFAKSAARLLAAAIILPELLSFWFRAWLFGRDRALESSTQMLGLIPGLVGQYLRRAFLARVLEACHPSATICFGVIFSKAGTQLGANAYIGPRCHIGLANIERDVLLAAGVHVPSGMHIHGSGDLSAPIRDQEGQTTRVHIGAGSWVGSAAVVMADVGRDTIIGAGAVVTKPLPDLVIAAGVPARVIRSRQEAALQLSK